MKRLYIFGPSGSGTTTLAARYAELRGAYHLDTDHYYWEDTDPPYKKPVPIEQRILDIVNSLEPHENWVISGCMCSWGESILNASTESVYLWLPWKIRRDRLRAREQRRYGDNCLEPDGSRFEHFREFEDWAQAYDTADATMRSRQRHEIWMRDYEDSGKKVLRMEQDISVDARINQLMQYLNLSEPTA